MPIEKLKPTELVPEQKYLPIQLPIIQGHKEYQQYCELLDRIDFLLQKSGVEKKLQRQAVAKVEKEHTIKLSERKRLRIQIKTSQSLRCNIVRCLSKESFRKFSLHLAESALLQRFCRLDCFEKIRIPAKSTLQEYSDEYSTETIREILNDLIKLSAQSDEQGDSVIELEQPLDLDTLLMDTTCVELNIHFPTDWVLLKDGVRSLTLAIESIRRYGLVWRIKEPKEFRREMNQLCMKMTMTNRRVDGKKKRKNILRLMKKLSKKAMLHGGRYRDLLEERWPETEIKEGAKNQIIKRIDNILEKLPEAIQQAHERIIGERQVENEDKILSLYQEKTQVYKRGKSGKNVEFGMQLFVAETMEGVIIDWELVDGHIKGDTNHVVPCLKRIQKNISELPKYMVGDRGFTSSGNTKELRRQGIEDCLCPKSVQELEHRLSDKMFSELLRRRAQTEARIGIITNQFIGSKMPMTGSPQQQKHVAWSILSHNLWVIARLPKRAVKIQKQAA